MVIGHRRPPISPSPSREVLQSKLTKLVSRHEQMKISYLQLKSQIDTGLHQAEEVFASLSIPLMKAYLNQGENFAAGATMAGKEIIEKRKVQFVHLVKLLRQIESQVNSSQDEILQNLENHHGFLQKSIQKSIGLVATLDSENHDTTVITVRLLQTISHHGLKDDMKNGACVRLLAMADEMEKVMKDGRIELEDARKKARLAEEGKIEALCKLKETVRRVRKLSEHLTSLSEPKRGLVDSSFSEKFSGMEEDRTKDDKLLWGILKKKRKFKVPESPLGPEVLLYFGATKGYP
ncbi:hypothetical protein OIU78_016636 [Salix suchowensis]|nr:hypothetical protein OIU78_016636 [Salix suchowensis]